MLEEGGSSLLLPGLELRAPHGPPLHVQRPSDIIYPITEGGAPPPSSPRIFFYFELFRHTFHVSKSLEGDALHTSADTDNNNAVKFYT